MSRPVPLDRLPVPLSAHRGLDAADARARLLRYGPNDIVDAVRHPWREIALDTAKDPMLWFFGLTGVLYALVGQRTEAMTLLVAIMPLLLMDAVLHRRTQASTEGLAGRLAAEAIVVRDGVETRVAAQGLVPGDIAVVDAGDVFPADGLVLAGADLQVDESSLTGESYPVLKRPTPWPPDDGEEPVVARDHWGYAGTRLLTGRAQVAIVFTGRDTVYGEIVRSARASGHANTPLQAAIQRLVSALLVASLVLCGVLVVARLQQGNGWLDAFVSAVTLATAAIPEEFPVVFAFYLGVGVYRLAKRQALVRRAVTVENIGRVTCICSDKTGTITAGALALTHLQPAAGMTRTNLLAVAAVVSRRRTGDPLDEAVHARLDEEGASADAVEILARFPYTENRKRETAIVRTAAGDEMAVTKGAAEVILGMTPLEADDRAEWMEKVAATARTGHKMITCAWKVLPAGAPLDAEPTDGFQLAGLLGFEDPVREGVAEAALACREAGIRTIMVTGDHPLTARAVAGQIGLGNGDPLVMSGEELHAAVANGESQRLEQVDVIARASPAEKLILVRALQAQGHIVAVTGDGVNDVPALQAADIGIAMGERGTRSAREVASIVLLEDNFRTIVDAIAEGRQLFRNLQSSFKYVLMTHIPLVITAALVPLGGYPLLYLPVHIIWLEMLIHPTAMLVFQELPARELRPTGQALRPRFFSRREWVVIVSLGLFVTALVAAGYLRSFGTGEADHGRAMAMAMLTLASAAITIVLSRLRTPMSRIIVGATVALGLVLIEVEPLARRLNLAPLHADDWMLAVGANVLVGAALLAGELWSSPGRPRRA